MQFRASRSEITNNSPILPRLVAAMRRQRPAKTATNVIVILARLPARDGYHQLMIGVHPKDR